MEAHEFARLFPKLYHVAYEANLPSIQEHGLLSSAALADLYRFTDEERDACVMRRRICKQDLHGISLRDQYPAHEARMKTCLVNITIPEWIALLNSKVFFFVSAEKAERFLKTYQGFRNVLFEVDTAALLRIHAKDASLCRINSGSFIYKAVPRGRDSFISLERYIYKKKRDTPAELTIDAHVPSLFEISTHTLHP